ncbi:MAG: glycosyltransferase [bacterium]
MEFLVARNGCLTAKYDDPALGPLTLYSIVDPMRAARRDLERWRSGGAGVIVALGVGLGYHLFPLADRYPGRKIVAIEARPALLRKSFEINDWSSLLKRPDFILADAESAASELRALNRDSAPAVFYHPVLFKLDMGFYFPIRKELTVGRGAFGRLRIMSFNARGDLVPYTLLDIHETLREMGHEVHSVDISAVKRQRELSDAVRHAAESFQPDFVVTVGPVGLCDDIIGRLGAPVAAWFMDNPFQQLALNEGEEGPRPKMLGDNFYAFSWDESYVPELRERGVRAYYLPLATNPRIHYPREATPDALSRYGSEISFIGTADRQDDRDYRLAYVGSLDGFDVGLWGGPGWRLVQGPGFRYRGRADNRNEGPIIYSLSKINLNLTTRQLITSIPIRVFDILACGGFLLTDSRKDLQRLFDPGADLAVFDSKSELRALAEHYIDNPEMRKKIALHGRQTVLARHTFRHRLEEMLKIIFK